MQINKYVIKKQFLEERRYNEIVENVIGYENLFKTWLGQISEFYRGSANPITGIPGTNAQYQTRKLHNLIYPFINTLYNISNQHLSYVGSIMRQSASVSLYRDSQKLIEKIKILSHSEQKIQNAYRDLLISQNRIVTSPTQNIQYFYYSSWFKRITAMEKYVRASKQISQNKPQLQKVYSLSLQVEVQLLEFRKKIMNYKYGYLKQGVKMSRNLLSCLSQYLSIGRQILGKIMVNLKKQIITPQSNSRLRTSNSYNSQSNLIQQVQMNFIEKAQQYKNTLSNIQNLFYFTKEKIDIKNLQMNFKQLYSGNDNLIDQMLDVYHLFEALASKRVLLYDKISLIIQKIQNQNKQKKRTAQVMNTIMKRKSLDQQTLSPANSDERLSRQFGLESIQKSLTEAIQYALKTFNELSSFCYSISAKTTSQKQNANNMSISYQYKEIKLKSKVPNKNQIWLWKDWRDFRIFSSINPKFTEKFILKELGLNKKFIENQTTEQKISCQIQGSRGGRASIQIFSERLQIKSKKQSLVHYIIPFKDIDQLQVAKKRLIFKMNGGAQIKITGLKDVGQSQKNIRSHMLKKQSPQNSFPKKPTIMITTEQQQSIKKKSAQMEQKRIKIDEYTKSGQLNMKGSTIQQVYELLFSQKSSCPLSKDMSFPQYFQAKNKNYNIKVGKYDNEGPYFYTGTNKQITFVNCPFISTRQCQMDHLLPKIPFIPKSCHCKSNQQIFWVSNKELDYCVDICSSGSEMMESFKTYTLYKVKQVDDGINLQIFSKIQFVKPTRMKKILQNGAEGQIKIIIPQMLKDIQKSLKLIIKARQSTGTSESQSNKAEQKQQKQATTQNSSSSQKSLALNKQILILAIATILINIFINLIF